MVMGELTQKTELLVIGGGPGGYAAALRAADLGMEVVLADQTPRLGGTCLRQGCLPSKILLQLCTLINDAARASAMGVDFGPPRIDLDALRRWKDNQIDCQARRLEMLAEKKGVQLIRGRAEFESSDRVRLHEADIQRITFGHCIVAAGAFSEEYPGMPFQPAGRILGPREALALARIPESLLVVGSGYIGLELGSIYAALGSRVHLVQGGPDLLPGADPDLTEPLRQRLQTAFAALDLGTRVSALRVSEAGLEANLEGGGRALAETLGFDSALIALHRRPRTQRLGLRHTEVALDENGFVQVDDRLRTSDARIYAVGDVTGGPLLAHKAARQGKVAAEAIAGRPTAFDVRAVPVVVHTDPQIAWCGLTEMQARRENRPFEVRHLPWKSSQRAVALDTADGLTKILTDPASGRILGVGIAGREAGHLIGEAALAIEMGALVEDLALTLHPHPTLAEITGEAAGMFLDTSGSMPLEDSLMCKDRAG